MLLLDGQVHHDTHSIPMGNYVIGVGNYMSATPSELGNYMSADICDGYDFPILFGLDVGHTDDKVTLPLGAVVEIDGQRGALSVPAAVLE